MENKKIILVILGVLIFSTLMPILGAGQETNLTGQQKNLQKIADYNKEQAFFYLRNLSFLAAFILGMISILSPCSFALLPAFFAYTFKERKDLVKMTLAFFLGFAPTFTVLGLLAAFAGKAIAGLQQDNRIIITISGILIMLFGIMTLFGKSLPTAAVKTKIGRSFLSIVLLGVLFALGFTACVGPAIFGVLLIASTFNSYFYAAFLTLSYSLGLFVPFFIASFIFEKYNLIGKISELNEKLGFSLTNVISGVILIAIGIVFIYYGGTYIVEYIGLGSLSAKGYAFQNYVLQYRTLNILVGAALLIAFLFFLWKVLRRKDEK